MGGARIAGVEILTVHTDSAPRGADATRENSQQGGLARAVGAEKGMDAAALEGQIDRSDRAGGTERLGTSSITTAASADAPSAGLGPTPTSRMSNCPDNLMPPSRRRGRKWCSLTCNAYRYSIPFIGTQALTQCSTERRIDPRALAV